MMDYSFQIDIDPSSGVFNVIPGYRWYGPISKQEEVYLKENIESLVKTTVDKYVGHVISERLKYQVSQDLNAMMTSILRSDPNQLLQPRLDSNHVVIYAAGFIDSFPTAFSFRELQWSEKFILLSDLPSKYTKKVCLVCDHDGKIKFLTTHEVSKNYFNRQDYELNEDLVYVRVR